MSTVTSMIDIGGKPTLCKSLTVTIHDVQADRVKVRNIESTDLQPFTTINIRHADGRHGPHSSLFILGTPEERAIELRRIADRLHAAADELLATTPQEA